MAIEVRTNARAKFVDKQWLRVQVKAADELAGFEVDPTMTALQVRQMMLDDGAVPDENAASREIVRLRYEDDNS